MRKWIVLMTVFLWVIVAIPTHATTIAMHNYSPQYWGSLTVDFDAKYDWTVGAGRFYTTIDTGEKQIDTFSYCVDLGNYFSWDKEYTAAVSQPTSAYREAAWLVSQYDPLTGKLYQGQSVTDGEAKSIAMTLQLAIWETLYEDRFFRRDSGVSGLFDEMMASLIPIDFVPSGFFVAEISGQDQLVAAPVPEPATMLLMGVGLLGLGVVGRKRLK